MQTRQTQEII